MWPGEKLMWENILLHYQPKYLEKPIHYMKWMQIDANFDSLDFIQAPGNTDIVETGPKGHPKAASSICLFTVLPKMKKHYDAPNSSHW